MLDLDAEDHGCILVTLCVLGNSVGASPEIGERSFAECSLTNPAACKLPSFRIQRLSDKMVLSEYTYVFAIGTFFALLDAFNNGASEYTHALQLCALY